MAHDEIWFDDHRRDAIGVAIERVVREAGYTTWAGAVLANHLHLVIRTHRDNSLTMLAKVAQATFEELHDKALVPEDHPVWSARPYKVFLKTRDQVYGRIDYVEKNPMKEGLPRQFWNFVTPCSL